MQLFLLISQPNSQDDKSIRGIFTSERKAKDFDPLLKNDWQGNDLDDEWNAFPHTRDAHRVVRVETNTELDI